MTKFADIISDDEDNDSGTNSDFDWSWIFGI